MRVTSRLRSLQAVNWLFFPLGSWLTQKLIANLFGGQRLAITKHLRKRKWYVPFWNHPLPTERLTKHMGLIVGYNTNPATLHKRKRQFCQQLTTSDFLAPTPDFDDAKDLSSASYTVSGKSNHAEKVEMILSLHSYRCGQSCVCGIHTVFALCFPLRRRRLTMLNPRLKPGVKHG